jgi:hypothetical protein
VSTPDLDFALPSRPMNRLTEVGFHMGAMEVVRVASIKGYSVLWVQTATKRYEIISSPRGRNLTVKGPYPPIRHATDEGVEL